MRHSKPVRFSTAPTGPDKSGSKSRGESVHLFFEFTINDPTKVVDNPSPIGAQRYEIFFGGEFRHIRSERLDG